MSFSDFFMTESQKKAKNEAAKKELAINKVEIYYTETVNFAYKILEGSILEIQITYIGSEPSEKITKTTKDIIRNIKKQAYEIGADALIAVKIAHTPGNHGDDFGTGCGYILTQATAIAIKKL